MTDPRYPGMALEACERCDGLVPAGRRVCVHCDRARPVWRGAKLAARILGASAAMVTLMACYGMMARPYNDGMGGYDNDGDGARTGTDCDDARGDVFPGAADLDGDGVDQNCDGVDGWNDPNAPRPVVAADPPAAVATDPPAENAAPPPEAAPKVIATDPP